MSDAPPVGWCDVPGCGRRSLFANETRCARHPLVHSIVVMLADGEVIGTLPVLKLETS